MKYAVLAQFGFSLKTAYKYVSGLIIGKYWEILPSCRHSSNLVKVLLRCGTKEYKWGTQWDSNSLVKLCSCNFLIRLGLINFLRDIISCSAEHTSSINFHFLKFKNKASVSVFVLGIPNTLNMRYVNWSLLISEVCHEMRWHIYIDIVNSLQYFCCWHFRNAN